ncbi:hypothetical protein [Candidatus Magnetaquicoccus inordinatus]|uniref:TubC N-terminal docking domain-related protein n=1 Tax=Candidatus Magnetaquicoccus inordinatus TaxID=2496818 RepID=UPI00102B1CC6|nr:hypothetical protein [Candidatus Magnetaquicoccus inordinatus]
MNRPPIIAELEEVGVSLYLDEDDALAYRATVGAMNEQIMAAIKEQKATIIAWLKYDPLLRPLTDEEKIRLAAAFRTLRDRHGRELHAAGWDRDAVFDGLDPTRCEVAGDVPAVLGLFMDGGRLVAVHPDRLDLEFPNGVPFSKIRGGCLMGGTVLEEFLRTGK